MSLKSSEKTGTNEYTLKIEIDGKTFRDALDKVFAKESRKINIPGFRKGKAPRAYVEKYFGEKVFFDEALERCFSDVYFDDVKNSDIDVVSDPYDFKVDEISKEDGAKVTCKVTVKPEVTLDDYKGIKAPKDKDDITDEDVEKELKSRQSGNARYIDVDDRPVKDGDIVTIDYLGKKDGKPFSGGKAEDSELTIGSGTFIPGFEEQLIGKSVGDEFVIDVKFPEDYSHEDLAGADATFDIKLKAIKYKELPELDDEFAKDISEFDTLDELKADIRKTLQERKTKQCEEKFKNAVLDELANKTHVEQLPDVMVERAIGEMMNEFDYNLRMQGLNLENYMKYTGMTQDQFKELYRERATKDVLLSLALEKIVKDEGFEATKEDLENEYKKISEAYGVDIEKVKSTLSEKTVIDDITKKKAVDLVCDSAVATEPKPDEKDEPENAKETEKQKTAAGEKKKKTVNKTSKKASEKTKKADDKAEEKSEDDAE